jgi:hypothetical protein
MSLGKALLLRWYRHETSDEFLHSSDLIHMPLYFH